MSLDLRCCYLVSLSLHLGSGIATAIDLFRNCLLTLGLFIIVN
jgi:hypothetical protein